MPCTEHQLSSRSGGRECVACFAADVLDFTAQLENPAFKLQHLLKQLEGRYRELAPEGDERDYCRSLIFGLNTKLVARKLPLFGTTQLSPVMPQQILATHRDAYRARLRRMGT